MSSESIKRTGISDKPITVAQTLGMEQTKFFPTDIVVPILLVFVVIYIEIVQGARTSVIGLLVAAPLTSAIFGQPRVVWLVSSLSLIVTGWLCVRGGTNLDIDKNILFLAVLLMSLLSIATSSLRLKKDEAFAEAIKELARLEIAKEVGSTDWLTGQRNRRGVAEAIERATQRFQSVVMFDIDGLKRVNDSFGHQIGDEYIKNVTSRIAANFKAEDIFGRWGGDEFVALLPLEEKAATKVVERVINEAFQTPIVIHGIEVQARVSAGVAAWVKGATIDQALTNADEALYGAKAMGGHQTLAYSNFLLSQ